MSKQRRGWMLIAGVIALAVLAPALRPARAQEARGVYDFEDGVQGFAPFVFKDGAPALDAAGSVSVSRENAKVGSGALAYAYKVEPAVMRALTAESRIPAGTKSVRFWVRCSNPTALILSARRANGADHQLSFFVPAHEWVPASANLDELSAGDQIADKSERLDPARVTSIALMDFAMILVNAQGEIAKALPNLQGSRTLWLDDLRFSPERVPQTMGLAGSPPNAYVVDNFEGPTVRWTPVKAQLNNGMPTFDIFPTSMSMKAVREAAASGDAKGPTDPGGSGLRISYTRGAGEAFAVVRSLERENLAKADRLRLSLNVSRKSLLIVQVKEKDESEYQHVLTPENTVGWQQLNLALSDLTLSDNSKDENNRLDPDQIKELTILDASAFLMGETGDVILDLDAISFGLK